MEIEPRSQTHMSKSRWYTGIIAILGWFALALQFYISINLYVGAGWTVGTAIIQILSFFTILTNLLVAVNLTVICLLPHSRSNNFFFKTINCN
jgi:hypothetical protein